PVGRAHRGDAHRSRRSRRDHLEFPGEADHGRRSDPRLWRSREMIVALRALDATDISRFGPKAGNLAALGQAGLPIPDGICLDARADRRQLQGLGRGATARAVFATDDAAEARRHALRMKLELLEQPIAAEIAGPLLDAWRDLVSKTGALTAVRSSALVEDR